VQVSLEDARHIDELHILLADEFWIFGGTTLHKEFSILRPEEQALKWAGSDAMEVTHRALDFFHAVTSV
jgi:hypothetical protein